MARKPDQWRLLVNKVPNISRGNVANRLRCDGVFNDHCILVLPTYAEWHAVKECRKSIGVRRSIRARVSWHTFLSRAVASGAVLFISLWFLKLLHTTIAIDITSSWHETHRIDARLLQYLSNVLCCHVAYLGTRSSLRRGRLSSISSDKLLTATTDR